MGKVLNNVNRVLIVTLAEVISMELVTNVEKTRKQRPLVLDQNSQLDNKSTDIREYQLLLRKWLIDPTKTQDLIASTCVMAGFEWPTILMITSKNHKSQFYARNMVMRAMSSLVWLKTDSLKGYEEQDSIKVMVVLAGPGEDKSGLCDLFSGTKNNFPANQEKTIGKLVNWRGDGDQFLLIDTPVFEPVEDVAETTKIMMNELKKYKNMYVFVIALNGTNPRMDQNRKKMIRELKKLFGHTFIEKNTVFAITNWHYDQGSIDKRGKRGQKEVRLTEHLIKELNLTNFNIAFLDASYGEEEIEKHKIEEELYKMEQWLFTMP